MAANRTGAATVDACVTDERERLTKIITRWNEHRLDLFEISLPNEKADFYGVIRFYFQNREKEVVTKCIRVHSTATSKTVVEALAEKFGLDLNPEGSSYALYEVHQNGEERKLYNEECPLFVQLNWSKGDRDGRFVFKEIQVSTSGNSPGKYCPPNSTKSSLHGGSRKDKKKKKRRFSGITSFEPSTTYKPPEADVNAHKLQGSLAKDIYKAVPDSRFTRSISNPEAVMRRQRHQKMIKRILSIRGKDGRHGSGGSIHIYAGSLAPENPFKTLAISKQTTSDEVIQAALEEYGFPSENPSHYCLVQMNVPMNSSRNVHLYIIGTSSNQRVLGGGELPLEIIKSLRSDKKENVTLFQMKKKDTSDGPLRDVDNCFLPHLVEVTADGKELPSGKKIPLTLERTILGSKRPSSPLPGNYVLISSSDMKPQHCEISDIEGVFTIAPIEEGAEVFVNSKPVHRQAFLSHKSLVRLGKSTSFCYIDPFESSRMAAITDDSSVTSSHHPSRSKHSYSPQLRERAMSHSALEGEQKCSRQAQEIERKLRATLSMEFDPTEEKTQGQDNTAPKLNSGVSRSANMSSMPAFPHNFTPPVAESKRRSPDPFLSSEVPPSFLPASISFHPTKEGPLLSNMILDIKLATLQFKLAPSFTLYMTARFHISPNFQPGANNSELKKHLVVMLKNSVSFMKRAIKEGRNTTQSLAFWMANASEFLHFLNCDPDISRLSQEYEQPLIAIVQNCYKNFFLCVSRDLGNVVPAFFDESEEADIEDSIHSDNDDGSLSSDMGVPSRNGGSVGTPHSTLSRQNNTSSTSSLGSRNSRRSRRVRPTIGDVMSALSSALSVLRKNSVNMSLTIQVFSLLIRFLNVKIVNRLFTESKYCSQFWGRRLSARLERIDVWAKRQGLELATDQNLKQAVQATMLLACPKYTSEDFRYVSSIDLLNSKQIEVLLDNYRLCKGEPTLSPPFANQLLTSAKMKRDKILVRDGQPVAVEEESSFNPSVGFVLPEVGYMGQVVQGVPQGLLDYTKPFVNMGLCIVTANEDSQGLWTHPQTTSTSLSGSSVEETVPTKDGSTPAHTVQLSQSPSHSCPEPKIAILEVMKLNGSLGISITGGKNAVSSHPDLGIFVKKLVSGGSAEKDGRLQPGDQILSVDGKSLQGLAQDRAAHILKNTGGSTTLTVAKQAAQFYDLMSIINMPSPGSARKPAPSDVHSGSSHAAKLSRRMEREKKAQHQPKPRSPHYPSTEMPLRDHNTTSPTEQITKWTSENRDPVNHHDAQWTTSSVWEKGSSYSHSGGWDANKREGVIPGMEGDDKQGLKGHQSHPHLRSHSPVGGRGGIVSHGSPEAFPSADVSANIQSSMNLQQHPQDSKMYSFVSHDTSALSSQPQPSTQLQMMTQNSSQLSFNASCSMDVQHASLTGNSLPHAMSVIAHYKPPKEDRAKGPVDPVLNQQLTNMVELREQVKQCGEWIKILESRRCAEEQHRQEMEREFCKRDMQSMVGPSGSEDYHHRTHHHQQRMMREFEEKRKQSNEKLKQIEVDRHSAKTKLQAYQHQLKMIELSLEAEESERKIEKLRNSEYVVSGGSELLDQKQRENESKMNNYDLRLVDGKEVSLGVTPCPPPTTTTSNRHQPLTASKSTDDSHSNQRHFPMSGYGSLQRNTTHFRQKSDSMFLGTTHNSEGGDSYRSLERRKEKPHANKYNHEDDLAHSRGGNISHSRSKSEGPGGFPALDELDVHHRGQHHVSSGVRQPGVGGWDHTAPPPQPMKPSSSSESSALQQIVLDEQFKHYNLSPTSESDIVIFPRPPPPGVAWDGPHDTQQTPVKPSYDHDTVTNTRKEEVPDFSEEPSNLKKWGDVRLWKNSDWASRKPRHSAHHGESASHHFTPQHPGNNHHLGSHHLDKPHSKPPSEAPYSPRHNLQYNFVGDVQSKEDTLSSAPHWNQGHKELQFHSPPMTSQEMTSSQITSYHDDIPTIDPYMHNRIISQSADDGGLQMRPPPNPDRKDHDSRENTRVFPSAYTSTVGVGRVQSYKPEPIPNPQMRNFDIGSPRVMPVTTRVDQSRLHPPLNQQGPPHPSNTKRTYPDAFRERPLHKPVNIATVSRTDL